LPTLEKEATLSKRASDEKLNTINEQSQPLW